jgi:hypothetical protein
MALTKEDIEKHNLPPDLVKRSDTRSEDFIEKHGDISVELDALHVDVLRERIEEGVKTNMNMEALAYIKKAEEAERRQIAAALR